MSRLKKDISRIIAIMIVGTMLAALNLKNITRLLTGKKKIIILRIQNITFTF